MAWLWAPIVRAQNVCTRGTSLHVHTAHARPSGIPPLLACWLASWLARWLARWTACLCPQWNCAGVAARYVPAVTLDQPIRARWRTITAALSISLSLRSACVSLFASSALIADLCRRCRRRRLSLYCCCLTISWSSQASATSIPTTKDIQPLRTLCGRSRHASPNTARP
jgi:hypothetical protein